MISIHAPTRGATEFRLGIADFDGISIHAPTRGATDMYPIKKPKVIISIHAPTRGATQRPNSAGFHKYFNPRSHERSDMHSTKMKLITSVFQSTLPREERLYWMVKEWRYLYFNPRSHERSD